LSAVDDFLGAEDSPREELRDEILAAIYYHERNRPRSLQQHLGPSEAGVECDRQLAHKIAGSPEINGDGDPLPSMIGTSMHTTMEDVAEKWNEHHYGGQKIWLPENKVKTPIPGTSDLYHVKRRTVIDWKFPGATRFKHYVEHGPSKQYREQVHLYGLGMEDEGYEVEFVAIMFIPRAGRLRSSHLWMEPYDRQRALRTAERIANIAIVVEALDVKNDPTLIQKVFKASPSDDCTFCPWFSPAAEGPHECCGVAGEPNEELR